MSGKRISTRAHNITNDVLRTSRRRFLTQVGLAGLGIGVPVSMATAQDTQRSPVGDGKEAPVAEKLARYATSLRYEDLPEDVVRIAKRTILDTLGCAFGGYSAGPSKIAIKLASDRHHEYATLEHLLLALIDDGDAQQVMKPCNVRRMSDAVPSRAVNEECQWISVPPLAIGVSVTSAR